MKSKLIIFISLLFISCSNNNSKDSSNENIKEKDKEIESQPVTCLFSENLTIEKLNNLWKKYKNNNEETVDYYYFGKDGNFSECSLKKISKLIVTNEKLKYFFHEPDKIEIEKNPKEYNFTYLFNNFSLNMRNSYTN